MMIHSRCSVLWIVISFTIHKLGWFLSCNGNNQSIVLEQTCILQTTIGIGHIASVKQGDLSQQDLRPLHILSNQFEVHIDQMQFIFGLR